MGFRRLKDIIYKFRRWLIAFIIGTAVLYGAGELTNIDKVQVEPKLQIKASSTDDILANEEVNVCKRDDTCELVVQYAYKTDKEVKSETVKYNKKDISEDLSKRTENAKFYNLEKDKWQAFFYGTAVYYKDNSKSKWFDILVATTTPEAWDKQINTAEKVLLKWFPRVPTALATDYTAGAGDGTAKYENSTNWATSREATDGTQVYNSDTCYAIMGKNSTGKYAFFRNFLPFDTSALDDTVTITAATVYIYAQDASSVDNDGKDFLSVVQTTQANPNGNIATADYDQCGNPTSPTEGVDSGSRVDYNNVTASAYNGIALNATGMGWIDKVNAITTNDNTKGTRLGIREGHDLLNEAYDGANNTENRVAFNCSASAGNKPYLAVTYTSGATAVAPDQSNDWIIIE